MKITALTWRRRLERRFAEYLVLPEGLDIKAEARKRQEWYEREYVPAIRRKITTRRKGTYCR